MGGFECASGICLSGECFDPSVSVDCIVDADCDEDAGEVCDAGECFLPTIVGGGFPVIVGPGGLAPGLCFTDFDCDEDAGEVCDAGECFAPTIVGGGFDISRPGGGLIFLGRGGDSCSMGFECASGICLS